MKRSSGSIKPPRATDDADARVVSGVFVTGSFTLGATVLLLSVFSSVSPIIPLLPFDDPNAVAFEDSIRFDTRDAFEDSVRFDTRDAFEDSVRFDAKDAFEDFVGFEDPDAVEDED